MSFMKSDLQGKRVILYVRVSTEDQVKGYSLAVQEEQLKLFCERNGLKIVAFFREDGASAKSFNRPEFKKCMTLLKSMKNFTDYFLVVKWDRFSRNMEESFATIKAFRKLGVIANAIDQWIDFEDPNHALMLAIHLATPQVENDVRSEKVTVAVRKARKEGRWLSKPPKGYIRIPDGINKSKIVPGPDAHFVVEAFERIADGVHSIDGVRKELVERGWDCSKTRFFKTLKNPFYMAKQVIPAYKNEPEEMVDCIHEPLISEDTYYKVQRNLKGVRDTRKKKYHNSPDLVLRGFLICQKCEKPLWGSFSRSKSKALYGYYHCNPCKERYPVDVVNNSFVEFLQKFVFPQEVLNLFEKLLRETFEENSNNKFALLESIEKKIEEINQKLLSLEVKFVEEKIESDTFSRVKTAYQEELVDLNTRKMNLQLKNDSYEKYVSFSVSMLSRPDKLFEELSVDGKKAFVSSICGKNLVFDGEQTRTPSLNKVVALLDSIHKRLLEPGTKKSGQKSPLVLDGTPSDILLEHLKQIYALKKYVA